MISKIYETAEQALDGLLRNGMSIASGGFGLCGIPETLIAAIARSGVRNLTVISNNAGVDDFGLGIMVRSRQISRIIASYVGENKEFERQYLSGELEVEFNPQGTLAERIRAGGAGIPAFYTRTGVGTILAEGKEIRTFAGFDHVMETGLVADLAIVKAWRADPFGNLVYRKSARNFNPIVATCGKVTIAEVEEIVGPGELDPSQIHTPGIYVQRVIHAACNEKRIEQKTLKKEAL